MERRTARILASLTTTAILLLSAVEASAQPTLVVGPNVNTSQLLGNHQEAAIAIDPSNPNRLFVASNTELAAGGLFAAFSTDGGATWNYTDPADGVIAQGGAGDIPTACCDPSVSFDAFGNLFLAYLDGAALQVVVALSTDGGQTFTLLTTLGVNTDQETIVTGPGGGVAPGSVWVTYQEAGVGIVAQGAPVTGLGVVGAFIAPQTAPGSPGGNFGDIVIGPAGQVVVTYQIPSGGEGPATIFVNTDADGLGAGVFGAVVAATPTNVGGFDFITPQPDRSVDAEAGLAYDRSGGPFGGRLYLVYTDEAPDESNDTNIFVRTSNDNGANWSAPVQVNDDATTQAQFLPRIAVDQTTGNVAVSWHDARNDPGNHDTQVFATISTDGGATFLPNVLVSAGTSDEDLSEPPGGGFADLDYGDYKGLAFHAGSFYPVWADNSNSTGDNPDGATRMDVYTTRVCVDTAAPVIDPSTVPAPIVAEQTSLAGTPVAVPLPTATDDCGPVTVVSDAPALFPLGVTLVTFTATDAVGNSVTATTTVTVVDTTPPGITGLTASPNRLWPPNHRFVPVSVSVSASDICDAAPACQIISVTSDEPVNGLGDGNTTPDWVITGDLTVDLRAERSGTGDGRVYTITVQCTDASGNTSTGTVTVTVPHSQKK